MRIGWFIILCVRTISVRLCMAEKQLPECWALVRSVWSTHYDDVTSHFRVEDISWPACGLLVFWLLHVIIPQQHNEAKQSKVVTMPCRHAQRHF